MKLIGTSSVSHWNSVSIPVSVRLALGVGKEKKWAIEWYTDGENVIARGKKGDKNSQTDNNG